MVPTAIVDCKHCGEPIFDVRLNTKYHKECTKPARDKTRAIKMTYL